MGSESESTISIKNAAELAQVVSLRANSGRGNANLQLALPSFEDWRALFQKRAGSFAHVFGCEETAEELRLEL